MDKKAIYKFLTGQNIPYEVTESVLTIITTASLLKKEPKADSVPQKGVSKDEQKDP